MNPVWLFDYDLTLYSFEEHHVLGSLDRNITRFLQVRFGWSESEADSRRRDYCAQYGTTLGGLRALHGVLPSDYFDFIHAGDHLRMPMSDPRKRELLLSLPGECWVFTNARKDWALRGLKAMEIEDCFQGILDIEFFQWESKPNPRVYQQVEMEVGAQGRNLIMLEDKAENLIPAQSRGWGTIYVNPDGIPAGMKCDIHIPHLMQLTPAHIQQLVSR